MAYAVRMRRTATCRAGIGVRRRSEANALRTTRGSASPGVHKEAVHEEAAQATDCRVRSAEAASAASAAAQSARQPQRRADRDRHPMAPPRASAHASCCWIARASCSACRYVRVCGVRRSRRQTSTTTTPRVWISGALQVSVDGKLVVEVVDGGRRTLLAATSRGPSTAKHEHADRRRDASDPRRRARARCPYSTARSSGTTASARRSTRATSSTIICATRWRRGWWSASTTSTRPSYSASARGRHRRRHGPRAAGAGARRVRRRIAARARRRGGDAREQRRRRVVGRAAGPSLRWRSSRWTRRSSSSSPSLAT